MLLDGTFTAATASRHKLLNLEQINRRLDMVQYAIHIHENPHEASSQEQPRKIPGWVAKTPSGRQRQLEMYRESQRILLEKLKENRERPAHHRKDENKIVVSPADPEAAVGRDKHNVIRPLYNVQYMTDVQSGFIVSYYVCSQCTDSGTLIPMITQTQAITTNGLQILHADSGYCSIRDLQDCQERQIDLWAPPRDNTNQVRKTESGETQIPSCEFKYDENTKQVTCPGGHGMPLVRRVEVERADGRRSPELRFEQSPEICAECPLKSRCLKGNAKRRTVSRQENQKLADDQAAKMKTPAGERSTKLRAAVSERRFADAKQHRDGGQQHGRTLVVVAAAVGLMVLAQNALTLLGLRKRNNSTAT